MSFTRTVALPVSPDEAFALITEPQRLRRWQTVSAVVDLRAGGQYRWTITPGHVAAGTYREVEPGKRIVFGWGWEGSEDLAPDASTVTVTIEPADGGSLVTLVHEGLSEEQAAMHAKGWNHYLERMVRLAATGEAGPDEWAQVPERLNPVTAADAALAVIQPVLRRLTTEDRPKPTPCAEFSCHELVEHLFGCPSCWPGRPAICLVPARGPAPGLAPHRGLLDEVVCKEQGRRSVPGCRPAVPDHPQGPDLRTHRRHRCRRDDLPARADRWPSELGLPVLLGCGMPR